VLGFGLEMAVPRGAKEIETEIEDGKKYAYAMVKRDEAYVMLMDAESFAEDLPILGKPEIGASASFYFDVDDVDALHESLKGKAEIALGPQDTWYGMREFCMKDCNGYVLCFASRKQAAE
jgi:uncharacterized glyoxalase superfamily protein PhnB